LIDLKAQQNVHYSFRVSKIELGKFASNSCLEMVWNSPASDFKVPTIDFCDWGIEKLSWHSEKFRVPECVKIRRRHSINNVFFQIAHVRGNFIIFHSHILTFTIFFRASDVSNPKKLLEIRYWTFLCQGIFLIIMLIGGDTSQKLILGATTCHKQWRWPRGVSKK